MEPFLSPIPLPALTPHLRAPQACIILFIASWEGLPESWMASSFFIYLPEAPSAQQWYSAVYFCITTVRVLGGGQGREIESDRELKREEGLEGEVCGPIRKGEN